MASQKSFLYHFTYKSFNYYYTNANKDISFEGQIYKSEYISHSAITISVDGNKNAASIFTDIDNAIVQYFTDFVPTDKIYVTIRKYNPGTLTPARYFYRGNVQEINIVNDYESEIKLVNLSQALGRVANRYTYQSVCNLFLYDNQCKVIRADYSINTKVVTVSEDTYECTVEDIVKPGVFDDTFFVNGTLTTLSLGNSVNITKVDIANKKITFDKYFKINVGEDVTLSAGCNRSTDCVTKFNNKINKLSEDYVPNRNPINGF